MSDGSEPAADAEPPLGTGDSVGPGRIPDEHAALARRLRAAEDRLFPVAMVDADRYQRAVGLVGSLARRLSESCADIDALAAAEEQARSWLDIIAVDEGISLEGLDAGLVVEAAMSQRFRALLTEQAAELRRQQIERARAAGQPWSVLEEPDPAAWGGGSARWVEVHVATDTVMVRSVVADPITGRAVYQLEVFGSPSASASNAQGIRAEEFGDRDAWLAAIDQVRIALESES